MEGERWQQSFSSWYLAGELDKPTNPGQGKDVNASLGSVGNSSGAAAAAANEPPDAFPYNQPIVTRI